MRVTYYLSLVIYSNSGLHKRFLRWVTWRTWKVTWKTPRPVSKLRRVTHTRLQVSDKSTHPIRPTYQLLASSTFLSKQTSNQPTILFSQNKSAPATSQMNRLTNFTSKSVPSQEEMGAKLYMVGSSFKSIFQPNKRNIISTFELGVMVILVKFAQKRERRVWTEEDLANASTGWPSTSQHGHFSSHLSHTYLEGLFLI
jgi:hypothetical protein